MFRSSVPNLVPRNGHTLHVGIVTRISGCAKQKEMSLDDQEANAKEEIRKLFDGPIDFQVISTVAKGESLDRPELKEIEARMGSGVYDLFVFDDLSRLVRGGEATRLLSVGVDNGTRSICICDDLDTINDSWEEDALNACSENVAHNSRTSRRIKQKTKNRFKKQGITPTRLIAGYCAAEKATCFADWQKIESATPIIKQGRDIIFDDTKNLSDVADYFNRMAFPVGRYCKRQSWNGTMVRRFYLNPILKGMPGRGFMHTVKIHQEGRRKSVKNPDGPVFRIEPHLAHLDAADFDAVNDILKARNAKYRRNAVGENASRASVPRKRTRFPGQHATCWYCGRQYVWGGNGITNNLMCTGAREWQCWNAVGFNGPLAARRIMETITASLYGLDGIDQQMSTLVQQAFDAGAGDANDWRQIQIAEATLERQKQNLVDAIAEHGHQMFASKLADIETSKRALAERRRKLDALQSRRLQMPDSAAGLRQQLEAQLGILSVDSFEAGQLLRLLVPEFHVYLVRFCDGGHPLPRARIKLSLAGNISDAHYVPGLLDLLGRSLTLDLFNAPQREQFRMEAVRLKAEGLNQYEIARELRTSQAAISKALLLNAQMLDRGLSSPCVVLSEPPADYPKLRRHKNAHYTFRPLEGYQPPTI
jgi:site-specific DNA recombinase